ncbi:acetylornithine transaminase, partial [Mycobacterium tuberculosis]|nr:acetylornithine transaminase [Mycobacterium tuberculosis]
MVDALAAPGFLAGVTAAGDYLRQRLAAVATATLGGGAVRGRGLLLALDLGRPIGPAVVAEALNRGLLLNSP